MERGQVLRGSLPAEYSLNKSLGALYYDSLYTIREKIIQMDSETGKTETAKYVRDRAVQVAMELKRTNIKEDDIVIICSRPNMDEAPVILGCLMSCVQLAPVDPDMERDQFRRILSILKPKAIFCDMRTHTHLKKIIQGFLIHYFVFKHYTDIRPSTKMFDQKIDPNFEPVQVEDLKTKNALIICTEGITNCPKLVKISQYALYLRTEQYNLLLPPNCKRVISFFSMMSNVDLLLICKTFETGICRVICCEFSEKLVDRLIKVLKIEFALLGTTNAKRFADYCGQNISCNPNPLKKIIIGGIPILDWEIKSLEKKIDAEVLNIYYLAECGLVSGLLGLPDEFDASTPIGGKLFPGVKVKLVNRITQEPVAVNKRGELCFSGPAFTSGFMENNPEINVELEESLQTKYYKTGDIASFNLLQQIFLHGRIEDIVKVGEDLFYLSDIEAVLRGHPNIDECYSFFFGDIVWSIAVTSDINFTAVDIFIYLQDRIPANQMPSRVYIFNDLPKTRTGKVKKCYLESLFRLESISK